MPYDLLHALKTRGLHLCLQGDRLLVGPPDRLDGLRDQIHTHSEALKTLVTGLGGQASAGAVLERYLSGYTLVTEPMALIEAVQRLRQAPEVAVDLETTGLDPRTDRVRIVALSSETETCLIDTAAFTVDTLRSCLEPLFSEGPRLVFHHALFDLEFLSYLGLEPSSGHRLYDTALAEQLIQHSGLDVLEMEPVGYPLSPIWSSGTSVFPSTSPCKNPTGAKTSPPSSFATPRGMPAPPSWSTSSSRRYWVS